MNRLRVPRTLHLPYTVLFFDLEELVLLLAGLFFGLVFSMQLFLIVCFAIWAYRKVKKRFPNGYLIHLLYKAGILKFSSFYPIYFEKRFNE